MKTATALEKAYPESTEKKGALRRYVSRLAGKIPDAYDIIPAQAFLEMHEILGAHIQAQLQHKVRVDGEAKPSWDRMLRNPVVDYILDLSVSMAGGKGRREDVELGKTAQVVSQPSRWSLGRRER